MMQEIALNHTLPIQLKSVNCTNVSSADMSVLNSSIQKIEQDLADIGQILTQMNSTNETTGANLQL